MNDLNSLNNTKPLEEGNPEPTPVIGANSEPAPVEQPVPMVGPVSAPTPAMTPEQKPKKNNSWIIIVVAVLVLAVGGVLLFTQTNIFKKKEETKTEEKKDKKEEDKKGPEDEEDYYKYNGIYNFDKYELKILYDGEYFRYCINDSMCGYLELEDGKWIFEMFDEKTSATFNDGSVLFESNQAEGITGTYKKSKDYTIKDYFDDSQGDTDLFDSEFNGHYKTDKYEMFTFQVSSTQVKVIIISEGYSFDIPFDIKSDGSLYRDFLDDIYTVTFDGNRNATFTTVKGEKELDGVYQYQGKIQFENVLKYTL